MRKEFENTDICITESFCYTPETQQCQSTIVQCKVKFLKKQLDFRLDFPKEPDTTFICK